MLVSVHRLAKNRYFWLLIQKLTSKAWKVLITCDDDHNDHDVDDDEDEDEELSDNVDMWWSWFW